MTDPSLQTRPAFDTLAIEAGQIADDVQSEWARLESHTRKWPDKKTMIDLNKLARRVATLRHIQQVLAELAPHEGFLKKITA